MALDLDQLITALLTKQSGGMKFTSLLTEVHAWCYERHETPPDPEELLDLCQHISSIGVLEYVMPLAKDLERTKWFIFFKPGSSSAVCNCSHATVLEGEGGTTQHGDNEEVGPRCHSTACHGEDGGAGTAHSG